MSDFTDDELDAALDSPEAEKRLPKAGDGGNLELWDDADPKAPPPQATPA
jgi:hypothetical protein